MEMDEHLEKVMTVEPFIFEVRQKPIVDISDGVVYQVVKIVNPGPLQRVYLMCETRDWCHVDTIRDSLEFCRKLALETYQKKQKENKKCQNKQKPK